MSARAQKFAFWTNTNLKCSSDIHPPNLRSSHPRVAIPTSPTAPQTLPRTEEMIGDVNGFDSNPFRLCLRFMMRVRFPIHLYYVQAKESSLWFSVSVILCLCDSLSLWFSVSVFSVSFTSNSGRRIEIYGDQTREGTKFFIENSYSPVYFRTSVR